MEVFVSLQFQGYGIEFPRTAHDVISARKSNISEDISFLFCTGQPSS